GGVVRPPLLPNPRASRSQAAPAERACAALAQDLRPPRIKDSQLVVAGARSADPVLPRSYERSTLGTACTHGKRASRLFKQRVRRTNCRISVDLGRLRYSGRMNGPRNVQEI